MNVSINFIARPVKTLVIVAPPRALADLRHAIHADVKSRIIAEIGKDLTKQGKVRPCDQKCPNYRDAAGPFTRMACSSATTTAPSPIAAPTRLTDPERTSPMANTP